MALWEGQEETREGQLVRGCTGALGELGQATVSMVSKTTQTLCWGLQG